MATTIKSADRTKAIIAAAAPLGDEPTAEQVTDLIAAVMIHLDGANAAVMGAVRGQLNQAKRSADWAAPTWGALRDALDLGDTAAADRTATKATRFVDPTAAPAAALSAAREAIDTLANLEDADLLRWIGFQADDDTSAADVIAAAADVENDTAATAKLIGKVCGVLKVAAPTEKVQHNRRYTAIPLTGWTFRGAAVTISPDGKTATAVKADGTVITDTPNKVCGALAATKSGSVNAWISLKDGAGRTAAQVHDDGAAMVAIAAAAADLDDDDTAADLDDVDTAAA